jgi:hypothetical protein
MRINGPATYLEALEAAADYNDQLTRHLRLRLEELEADGRELASKLAAERAHPTRIRKSRARLNQESKT